MPKTRPKPPTETKTQLMEMLGVALSVKFPTREQEREYLLNFFTAVDLQEILRELRDGC